MRKKKQLSRNAGKKYDGNVASRNLPTFGLHVGESVNRKTATVWHDVMRQGLRGSTPVKTLFLSEYKKKG